jgi:hypothetical protein
MIECSVIHSQFRMYIRLGEDLYGSYIEGLWVFINLGTSSLATLDLGT